MKKSVPNFLTVFEAKLDTLKEHIKSEYNKNKKERSTAKLKSLVREARQLRNSIREAREEHSIKCPHCGKAI